MARRRSTTEELVLGAERLLDRVRRGLKAVTGTRSESSTRAATEPSSAEAATAEPAGSPLSDVDTFLKDVERTLKK